MPDDLDNFIKSYDISKLPQYHFDRASFVDAFKEVFSTDDLLDLYVACQKNTKLDNFYLYYDTFEEFYIWHIPSGTIINWYKHLGRTNTCNKEDYSIADLHEFLQLLKSEFIVEED